MKSKDYILKALKEADDYLSGEDLARAMNISRAAVWQAIKALRQDGYLIDAVTNRGYRLNENYEALDAERIRSRLTDDLKDVTVSVLDRVDSTNDAIFREDAASPLPSFSFMTAEEQTAGKGRVGKSFLSPYGTGLYLSTIIHADDAPDPSLITMAAAVALKEAITEQTSDDVKIKWVNDLYFNHKKIAGILTEADFSQGKARYVIGLGINTHTPQNLFEKQALPTAGSLTGNISRNQLAADLMNALYRWIQRPADEILNAYRKYNLTIGKTIRFAKGDIEYTGVAEAIDDDGALLVAVEGRTLRLSAGAISIEGSW
ncbi:biotin--[acetyl-CoA-carboxylase] ligase [Aedoeadaptatus acetigenes]|uniref:Bifunctional ligase/repressor BirA n=1 Tax=Aedoeadaptatus acetigenes TaxID=2981723 RepID=A0ABV1J862_9FIRM|nr:biotin--[acetyl-CoA-carboxylase] ligase [Peptoniphilaceae bacterium]